MPSPPHEQLDLFCVHESITVSPLEAHTLGHINCPACRELKNSMLNALSPDLEFTSAAQILMKTRTIDAIPGALTARYIRKNTEESYEQYTRSLGLFFEGHQLKDIHLGHFGTYQRARITGAEPFIRYRRPQDAKSKMIEGAMIPAKGKTPCPAKAKKINQELGLLKSILKRAGCWTEQMNEMYEPLLDDEEEIPRALSPEEQRRWLDVANMRSEWSTVLYYSMVAFDTLMSTDELRGQRLGDINLFQRVTTVRRKTAKNRYRARTIELVTGDVLWAYEKLIERAKDLGATDFKDHLYPWREKIGCYDATKPMSESGIKVAWNQVRSASGLTWFRQYDCRHTGITRLAESGTPLPVIKARAGHISDKMSAHYTHISQSSQRKWMEHNQTYQQLSNVPRFQPHTSTMPRPAFRTA